MTATSVDSEQFDQSIRGLDAVHTCDGISAGEVWKNTDECCDLPANWSAGQTERDHHGAEELWKTENSKIQQR